MTTGTLLNDVLANDSGPRLDRYHHVILDEVHDGSVNVEILLPKLRQYHNEKYETAGLRVTVMSATISSDEYLSFFRQGARRGPTLFKCIGASPYHVPPPYFLPINELVSSGALATADLTLLLHLKKPMRPLGNSILAFLPGRRDIDEAYEILEKACNTPGLHPTSLLIEKATGGAQSIKLSKFTPPPNTRMSVEN